jgi:hypothetical protein
MQPNALLAWQNFIMQKVGVTSKSLLGEHDDRFVVDLWHDIPFVAEALNEFPEGLYLLLYDASQVAIDSWSLVGGPKVVDKLPA